MLSPSLVGQFAAFSNSVPSSGGTYTGAVLFADGVQAAPGIAFSSATSTGLWRNTSNGNLVVVIGAVIAAYFGVDGSFNVNTANLFGPVRLLEAAPATSGSTGSVGQIAVDTGFIYVCTAANTWKRVALSAF